ncbi:MAG: SAM-dependent methyltransferase [Planctomycetes bacterium]|nr:SAM-dependent methyltransferase [Planctomycetota bacterium]
MNNRLAMKTKQQVEFGDFQTPRGLAAAVCRVLKRRRALPASIVEPTCGVGQILSAALTAFPEFQQALGMELNTSHLRDAKRTIGAAGGRVKLRKADFFHTDWSKAFSCLPEPILIIGNPPWVCNSELGAIGGTNLPTKSNASRSRGIDAITGKSNFDVSESMISRLLDALQGRIATLAMLCKTSVARKVLAKAWQDEALIQRTTVHRIDSQKTFGVAVDACLLTVDVGDRAGKQECQVFDRLDARTSNSRFGMRDGRLVADISLYNRRSSLLVGSRDRWRSGIKHDCARVMELRQEGSRFRNGLGELVELETRYLYPMLKSSEIASTGNATPTRWMLVPQQCVGEETNSIEHIAPQTWHYLQSHRDRLSRRASAIYRGKPPFSIFGVGAYSFTPWKVAISGLYKELSFTILGPHQSKPIVLDDTCYALSFDSRESAANYCDLLNDDAVKEALNALIFWDSKRPITAGVLNLVDVSQLASQRTSRQVA